MILIFFYGVFLGCLFGFIVVLEWLCQLYYLCCIDMFGQVQGEDYCCFNLLGEIFMLWIVQGELFSESLVIFNYFVVKGVMQGLGFVQGIFGFDCFNYWLVYFNISFFGVYVLFWYVLEYVEGDDGKVLCVYGIIKVCQVYQVLEQMFSIGLWLLGEQCSFVDVYFVGIVCWNDYYQVVDCCEFFRVQQLFQCLQDDVGVQFVYVIEVQWLVISSGGFFGEVWLEDVFEVVVV